MRNMQKALLYALLLPNKQLAQLQEEGKLTQLMMIMSLGVKQGDEITVAADGADEDAAIEALQAFFTANL